MKLGRRRFGLLAVLTSLAARRAFSAPAPPDHAAVLAAVAQLLFPHDEVSMQTYRGIAAAFLPANASQGERLVSALGNDRFLSLSPAERTDTLRKLETTPGFLAFRFHVMTLLYNDLTLTRHFGYQGPSLADGGYLHRGFGDITWLSDTEALQNED